MAIERIFYIKGNDACRIHIEYQAILDNMTAAAGFPPEIVNLDGDEASPADIEYSLETSGLFASPRLVWWKDPRLLRSAGRKKSSGDDEFVDVLQQLEQPGESVLVVSLHTEDEKKAARKPARKKSPAKPSESSRGRSLEAWLEANALLRSLGPMSPEELEQWIMEEMKRRGLTARRDEIVHLARSGQDMYYLATLLDKLSLLASAGKISRELLDQELEIKQEASIFRMLDSMSERKPDRAVLQLNSLLEQGQVPLVILTMMARELKAMARVKALLDKQRRAEEIQAELKLAPFVVKKHMKNSRAFKWKDIERLYAKFLETDIAFKSTQKSERLLLENLIMEYSSGK